MSSMRSQVVPTPDNPSRSVPTMPIPVLGPRAKARFESRYKIDGAGCWLWEGTLNPKGYGVFSIHGQTYRAHRISYTLHRGPIPKGFTLDHLCRVRNCVKPDDLEPVSNRENTLRGNSPSAIHARQTHCIHGHKFTEENTRITPKGQRDCRECNRQKWHRNRAKRLARQTDG